MSATTQSPTIELDELRSRVRWQPFHGFMWECCPSCGSYDLITDMRLAGNTHRLFTKCAACRDIVGWAADQDKQIRDRLRDLGADIERRVAR